MATVLGKSRNAVSAQLAMQLMDSYFDVGAGTIRPNNFVAMARQTYGYVVASAPYSSTD
ncbi:MAG: hypothetical protein KJO95_05820 [Gammaproteobacteria bacterium]|nr:hypothetical protein [Gammaproteobacteria bacterium]